MVMAPEEPPRTDLRVGRPRRWWVVIVVAAALVVAGVVLGLWLADDDDVGVGPVGPVGPQDPVVVDGPDAVVGSGTIATEPRDVPEFDAVTIAGVGTVVVRQASPPSLVVRTDDNLLPLITTEVAAATLTIGTADEVAIDPSDEVRVEITAPDVAAVGISGVGSITIDELATDRLVISLTGVGDIEIAGLEATKLVVDAAGVGSIQVAGRVETQEVALAGNVAYDAAELRSFEGLVDTESIGDAVVWVRDRLDVVVRSLGSVHYYGQPEVTSSISGPGEVQSLGDK